jgi:radical SAM protein
VSEPKTIAPVRRLRHDPAQQPFIVIWEVTRACQLACLHCRADAIRSRDPFELSTAEGEQLLADLATLGPPRPIVVLTGGDPVERADLADLVAHGTSLGLSIALSPSVTPRLTSSVLAELQAAGAKAVSLSLDGATARSHDGFRGVDGVFEATLAAIAAVRELGLRLQINTTITRDNVLELPAILGAVIEAGASLWSTFFLVPTGRGKRLQPLTADEEEDVLHWLYDVSPRMAIKTTEAPQYRRIVIQRSGSTGHSPSGGALAARLRHDTAALLEGTAGARRPRRPPIDVNSGRGFAFIDHRGIVYPSGFLPVAVGSVRAQPFPVIYRDALLFRALRNPDMLGGKCGRCAFREICGGSRSRAFAHTGDPLAEDPSCLYQPLPAPAAQIPSQQQVV